MKSSTIELPRPSARNGVKRSAEPPDRASVPEAGVVPPPRMRRRPAVVALSLALVVLGALLSVWAYSSLGNAQQVIAVRADISRGEVITVEALQVVRVGVDPALQVVPAADLGLLVGQRAGADLRAGQLVVPSAVTTEVVPHAGFSVVGLSLGAGQLPADALQVGDAIRVVSTPGQQGDVVEAELRVFDGTVISVAPVDTSGNVALVVEVAALQAPELAARSASGKLAIVLDSRER